MGGPVSVDPAKCTVTLALLVVRDSLARYIRTTAGSRLLPRSKAVAGMERPSGGTARRVDYLELITKFDPALAGRRVGRRSFLRNYGRVLR